MGSNPILPALPDVDEPHDSGFSKSESGRLVRVETHLYYVSKQVEAVHKDLQESTRVFQEKHDLHHASIAAAHSKIKTINTHLGWMKAIWLAVQGSVLAWLGLKH